MAALRQLMKKQWVSQHWNLICLHRSVGGLRWKSSYRPAPLLTAAPPRGLVDDQISIEGRFLPPHCPVTVCAQMHSEQGDLWEAFAHYKSDADGTVNLTRDHSVGGSYLGCEPMGLFWCLQPGPGAREGLRLMKINVETPFVVLVSLLEGHVSPSERQSSELAAVTTERWYMAPGVRRTEIRQNGLVGTLFLPPGPGPFPAVLDLWGAGGGLIEYRSALLASRGYASLSLAYMKHKELPAIKSSLNVSDSYFKSAFHLLQDHHQISADKVGVIALSYGGYLGLRIATDIGLKPTCLVCINGHVGNVLKHSETDERAKPIESDHTLWTYDDQGRAIGRNNTLPSNFSSKGKLKIDQINCPLMFIESGDDQCISSIENANLIEETLRAAGKSQLLTRFSYPGAGHLIEPPYAPNAGASLVSAKPKNVILLWGGQLAPHAAAQEAAWKKMLDFLALHLR